MSSIIRKTKTAGRVLRTQGVQGILSVFADKRAGVNRWMRREDSALQWYLGKTVELMGNTVTVDDCRFSVNNPAITTVRKSLFFFNRYEAPERAVLARFLDPQLPVVEFGGSIGVVACLTNKRLDDPHKHVVVEANPQLLPTLTHNRDRNNCKFSILHSAVAYGSDQVAFRQDDDFLGSRVPSQHDKTITSSQRGKTIIVPTTNLRSVTEQFNFHRCTMICDIEGAECDLVQQEPDVLSTRVATLIIETHECFVGAEVTQSMFRQLEQVNFMNIFREHGTYVFKNLALPSR